MNKKAETLSFISKISRDFVKREIEKHNAKLEHIRRTLAERAEGIADAIKYQKEGADWRRKQTIKECEAWMNSTNTPHYLRSDYLARAKESCDNDYISKVARLYSVLNLTSLRRL